MYLGLKHESENIKNITDITPSIVTNENMRNMTKVMYPGTSISENTLMMTNVMLACVTRNQTSDKSISLNPQYKKVTVYHGQNGGAL